MDSDEAVEKMKNVAKGIVDVRNIIVNNASISQHQEPYKQAKKEEDTLTHPLFRAPSVGKKKSKALEKDGNLATEVVALKAELAAKKIEIEVLDKKLRFVYAVFEEGKEAFLTNIEEDYVEMQSKVWEQIKPAE